MYAPVALRHSAIAAVVEGTPPVVRCGTGGSSGSRSRGRAHGGLSGTYVPGSPVMCYTGCSEAGDVRPRTVEELRLSSPSRGLLHRTPHAMSGGHLLRACILLKASQHDVTEGPKGAGVRSAHNRTCVALSERRSALRGDGVRTRQEHASRELRMRNDVGNSRHGLVSMPVDGFDGRVVRLLCGSPGAEMLASAALGGRLQDIGTSARRHEAVDRLHPRFDDASWRVQCGCTTGRMERGS